jgi:hypothetical protein
VLYWELDFHRWDYRYRKIYISEKAYQHVDWPNVFLALPYFGFGDMVILSHTFFSFYPYRFMKVAGSTVDAVTWQQ